MHVREKIVAAALCDFVVLIGPDGVQEKVVQVLGTRGKLPVEVLEFGMPVCRTKLEEMGHRLLDAHVMDSCGSPTMAIRFSNVALDQWRIQRDWSERFAIPGVVGTGLFIGMADAVIIQDGARWR